MITITKTGTSGILVPELNIGFDYGGDRITHRFISHAHADHMPRGKTGRANPVYCSPNTAKLMKQRGYRGEATAIPFGEQVDLPGARVTLYPAGHILGSSMIFVESDHGSLLYTGDYRTPPSPATEGFSLPDKIDFLVTEATFSLPVYRWPDSRELARQVRQFARNSLKDGYTPVYLAYNLGKAQEVMHLLADISRGQAPIQIHSAGFKLCPVYEEAGIDLGRYESYNRDTSEGKILIAPRSAINNGFASHIDKKRLAYCSGWATREATRSQMTVDELIPLSDHLDFFELITLCKKLKPKCTYITHTPNPNVVQHYLEEADLKAIFLD